MAYPKITTSPSVRLRWLTVILGLLLVSGLVYGWSRLTASPRPVAQAMPTVSSPTQTANAVQTAFAGGAIPQATLTIPSTPIPGVTPQWRTIAHLYNTQPGSGPSGQFVVLAGAKARIQWSCTVATNDPSATMGCSAALYNAKTGSRLGTLIDTNTNASGVYTIPVSPTAVMYELHIATDNEGFGAYYQVYQ